MNQSDSVDGRSAGDTIFKILTGMQSGIEVSLAAGDYVLGTGADDDIQLIDVSIKPAHARLRLSAGKIELAGGSGSLRTAAGLVLEPNGAFQQIEPLDVVTAGTTRFALGHPTSQWATIAEDDGEPANARPPGPQGWRASLSTGGLRGVAVPLAALALLLAFAAWFALGGGLNPLIGRLERDRDELAATRAALDEFPFGRSVGARREVDGTIYVSGYVDTPVERRALAGALEKTGVPARTRIWVLQSIRGEVESLIAAQKLPVTASLASDGTLTLDGLIVNGERANRFVELVKDRVIGLGEVRSRIRTAATLLAEVERLAATTQIQPYVLLRTTSDLIEATGAIPAEKVDAYVGFLQSYARRFAKDIPLRSFVQLQGAAGTGQAVVLGTDAGGNDVALGLDRLAQGTYTLNDIFPGAPSRPQPAPRRPVETTEKATPSPPRSDADNPAPERASTNGLTGDARDLIDRWAARRLEGDPRSRAMRSALEALRGLDPNAKPGALPGWYLPTLAQEKPGGEIASCWADTELRPRDVVAALFWLDLMSLDEGVSLTAMNRDQQQQVLEVAVNPVRSAACARREPDTAAAAARSVYLREAGRNPNFVRYIARELPPFSLDIAGANLLPARFVLTRAGRRIYEGAAPDQTSRVAAIGELGVVVRLKTGLAAVIFDPELTWKITQ